MKRISPVLVAGLCLTAPGLALAGTPTIGSPDTVTADPTVPRPATTPCAVQLFSHVAFADFTPKPFTYTPPAACPGPWAKVVLEGDFSVTAGRQFDRTAQIAVGHVNIYYGTTQEPSRTVSPTWHVERDLTDYTSLFQAAQSGEVNLGNLVNSTFTGIIDGSARLLFYPPSASAPAPWSADLVLSLSTAPGGAALLDTGASLLAPTLSLPTNIEGAYLDVIAQSQSSDEFWYACVPDDVADELFSCPGTSFREAEITVDGQPAGVSPVYPWLYTGAIDPLLWRPIPGVQTLNFVPYRVDLTPFAGVLSNGQPHQVGVRVFNASHYFLVAASLLLDLDPGTVQVTGEVTGNTLAAEPPVSIAENLSTAPDGSVTGTVTTGSRRGFSISGYVETSHGRVETTVRQELSFTNEQDFVVADTQYVQNIRQTTRITSGTETKAGPAVIHTERHFVYPLTLDISLLANADGSLAQTTSVDQSFESETARGSSGSPHMSRVSNSVVSADTLLFDASGAVVGFQDRASSQTYESRSNEGDCYSRSIAAVDGLLTSLTDGAGCGNGH
ncbi:MAG TPA: peptide-N4-asparagine amidase [Thermoanaerobaculia bacterium]|nr:peptide-N4-asparagine amidase [Thermoanaerobaculia bacterium]